MTAQPHKLRLFDFTMIVVSLVIGMGIFRTPLNVAKVSPDTGLFFATWVAGGIVALCGALIFAEIGSRLPVTGGYYKLFAVVFHPAIAFAMNCVILVSNAASLAAVTLVGSEYITGLFMPLAQNAAWLAEASNANTVQQVHITIAITAILTFYGVNLSGLSVSAKVQTVLMLLKLSLIGLLITSIFFAEAAAPVLPAIAVTTSLQDYLKAFGIGLVAVSFTYGGYQQTINFGAEVQQPAKTIPRGIFLGIAIIIGVYLCINYAYIKVIGFENLKHSTNIAAILAGKVFGQHAEQILSSFLFLGVLAYVNVLLLSNPRVMCAMSEDHILPAIFSQRNPNTAALNVSLTVFAGLSIVIVFWAQAFDKILNFTIFLDCFGMILSAIALFILRHKTPHLATSDIYQLRLFPLIPIVFILAYGFVALSIAYDYQNNSYAAAIGLAVMALFIGVYFLLQRLNPHPKQY